MKLNIWMAKSKLETLQNAIYLEGTDKVLIEEYKDIRETQGHLNSRNIRKS